MCVTVYTFPCSGIYAYAILKDGVTESEEEVGVHELGDVSTLADPSVLERIIQKHVQKT